MSKFCFVVLLLNASKTFIVVYSWFLDVVIICTWQHVSTRFLVVYIVCQFVALSKKWNLHLRRCL